MQDQVLTNKIKKFHFNETKLDDRFDFYRVKLPSDIKYAQKLSKIINTLSPISYVYFNSEIYYAMLPKASLIKQDDDLAIKPISANHLKENQELVLAKLLLRAIPLLMGDDNCVGADGLYYLVHKKKFKEFDCFVGLNIDFKKVDSPFFCNILTIKAQTFTPFAMHHESKVSQYPRFDASLFKKIIKRSSKGEYIKKGIPKTKASVDMIDINGEELSMFNRSKCGYLNQAKLHIKRIYDDTFTFELEYSISGNRIHPSKKILQNDYQRIYTYLKNQGINVCNLSSEKYLTNKITEEIMQLANVVPEFSDKLLPSMPNLVLIHKEKYYEEFCINDPYLSVKHVDPFSQIVTIDDLILKEKVNKEQLSAALKELVIKQEIKEEKLSLKSLAGHWGFAYVTQEEDEEEFTYHYLEIISDIIKYRPMTPVEWLEYSDAHFDIESKNQYLVIDYDDDYYVLITESELMAIPEYHEIYERLLAVEKGRNTPIPLNTIQDYMNRIRESKDKIEQDLLRELDEVMTRNTNKNEISYEELYIMKKDEKGKYKKKGIAYQGKKQKLYDFLRDEHGIHLKTSMKSKDGVLSSTLGFFYSPTTECYYVGSHEGAKSTINNFCKFRHVETDYAEIPAKLWEQLDAFYIRHKQSTVLPFAFKYLRECHEINQRRHEHDY